MYLADEPSSAAPCETFIAGIPCVRSITRAWGAIRAITPWQTPTNSSVSP